MKMSHDYGGEYYYSPCCSFHPKELVVGICALCLRERLLDLASLKQGHHHHHHNINPKESRRRKAGISLPRSVFALGSFLRLDTLRRRPDVSSDQGSIASLEDSFISIKFEDNGELASWKSKKKKKKEDSAIMNTNMRRQQGKVLMMKHPNPSPTSLIRWRKRMDQLLQLVVRWKRSATTSSEGSHVAMAAKVEVGRRRRWWMRNLTSTRRTRVS